jgi:hypothetical protein
MEARTIFVSQPRAEEPLTVTSLAASHSAVDGTAERPAPGLAPAPDAAVLAPAGAMPLGAAPVDLAAPVAAGSGFVVAAPDRSPLPDPSHPLANTNESTSPHPIDRVMVFNPC